MNFYADLLKHADSGVALVPPKDAAMALRELAAKLDAGEVNLHQIKVSKTSSRVYDIAPIFTIAFVVTDKP